jgi:aspartate racemase
VFEASILESVGIPLISIIDETIAAIDQQCPGAEAVGVLATNGCLRAGVYQQALEKAGLRSLLPSDSELDELMELIGRIKGGDKDDDIADAMHDIASALIERGAQAIIAGCTEIPLVLDDAMLAVPLISSTNVLAQKTVQLARGELPLPDQE